MSDAYQIKAGQRGKVLRFRTGVDLTAATTINVRVRRQNDTINIYPATRNSLDPTAADLTITAGMFDAEETANVDIEIISPGRVLRLDFNLTFDIGDL